MEAHTHASFPLQLYCTRIHGLDFTNASSLSKNFHDKSTTARKFTSLLLLVTKRWTHKATEGTHIESHIQPKKMLPDLPAVFVGLAYHLIPLAFHAQVAPVRMEDYKVKDSIPPPHTIGSNGRPRGGQAPQNKEWNLIKMFSRTMRYVSIHISL